MILNLDLSNRMYECSNFSSTCLMHILSQEYASFLIIYIEMKQIRSDHKLYKIRFNN